MKSRKKQQHLATKKVLFHQDNAPVHASVIAMAKIDELKFKLLPHVQCSPDLASSDYFLFPNLKKSLDGQRFVYNVLDCSNYKQRIEAIEHRWEKCNEPKGDYVGR